MSNDQVRIKVLEAENEQLREEVALLSNRLHDANHDAETIEDLRQDLESAAGPWMAYPENMPKADGFYLVVRETNNRPLIALIDRGCWVEAYSSILLADVIKFAEIMG